MERNIGTLDASLRITFGLLGLAYGIGRMSRRPYRTPWVLMSMSAMKIAEGTTRFCPMLYAAGMSTREDQNASLFRQNDKNKAMSKKNHASEHGKMEDQIIKTVASELEEALHASPSSAPKEHTQRSSEQPRREGMYARRGRRIGTDYQQQEQRQPNH